MAISILVYTLVCLLIAEAGMQLVLTTHIK